MGPILHLPANDRKSKRQSTAALPDADVTHVTPLLPQGFETRLSPAAFDYLTAREDQDENAGCPHLTSATTGLRIAGEPEADGAGLGIVGIGFENSEVMLACFGWVMQLLGVEIAKRKVRAGVVRIFFEELFKFAD